MRNPYDAIGRIGLLLAIAGAVNWLLVGIFQWNLVKWIFTQSGTQTVGNLGERIVYIVVGVGGVLAIPMLAATLARARGRDVRADESYERDRARDDRDRRELAVDDAAFSHGAPREARAEQTGPVRKTERVIIRTEEPITSSGESRASADESLRYGSVEEADDEYGESTEERRAA
jgi:uncharacterized protein